MITHNNTFEMILSAYQHQIGKDFVGYRNHCYRVLNFYVWLLNKHQQPIDLEQAAIALAFHDIGIWTDKTVDYLPPSEREAQAYCQQNQRTDAEKIIAMISEHHKVSAYAKDLQVELFRQADLVDFSLGLIRQGVDKRFITQVKHAFPNAGFHQRLVVLGLQHWWKNPLNPVPMMKR